MEQALVNERRDELEDSAAVPVRRLHDGHGRIERKAADEQAQSFEDHLLLWIEQIEAPGDRASHRLLALR